MDYPKEATTFINITPTNRITLVTRSWINPDFKTRWNDFPADFAYLSPVTNNTVLWTHNPIPFLAFAGLTLTIGDRGNSSRKDGRYRHWSSIDLIGCCSNGSITTLDTKNIETDGGTEGPFSPPAFMDNIKLTRINDSSYEIVYRVWGNPDRTAEIFLLERIRTRTATKIYVWVKCIIGCDISDHFTSNLRAFGSNFPTHEFYANSTPFISKPQGPISELWKANLRDPGFVIGDLSWPHKQRTM